MIDDIEQYNRYSPLMAALAGRDEAHSAETLKKYSELPDETRELLADVATAEKVQAWEAAGVFPPAYAAAVAKLIGLAVLGTITTEQIPDLLQRLKLDAATVQRITEAIKTIVNPALAFIAGYNEPVNLDITPVPPLAVHAPAPSEPQAAKGNIIDLRKQP